VRPRPAEEFAAPDARQVVGHEIVTEAVALVDGDVHVAGARLEVEADGIPQTVGEGRTTRAVEVHAQHRRPRRLLDVVVALRSDGHEEVLSIRAHPHVTRPILAITTTKQLHDALTRSIEPYLTPLVRPTQDNTGISEIKMGVHEDHAE